MLYMVVRYQKDGPKRIVATCLTVEEAQTLCQDPRTQGERWFLGFTAQRYRVTTKSGRTVATNLLIDEAERIAAKTNRTIKPVERW